MTTDRNGIKGTVYINLYYENGVLKDHREIHNLITSAGDLYYATRAGAAVVDADGGAPVVTDATKVNGMKLGVGITVPAKSGAGAALVNYLTVSQQPFAATYPTVTAVGGDAGYNLTYYGIWAPTVATNTALTEAVIVNDAGVNATTSEANTIARVTFTAINKQAGDTLEISWVHKFLGA